MIKNLTIFGLAIVPAIATAQSFSDDFESYTAGDNLAQKSSTWATWSGPGGGGSDDVKVVNTKAKSGSNSVYFSSTLTNGGPSDIVLPFGGQYTTGIFDLQMAMFVESGKNAYFNFQEQTTVGKGYSIDCYITNTSDINISNATAGALFTTKYTQNQWFVLELKIDLNTNTWEVLIDGTSKGTFQNGSRQIASMDLFPINGSGFYVDDVSYTYTPFSTPTKDAAVTFISNVTGYLASSKVVPSVEFRNLGSTAITSCKLSLTYNSNTETKDVTGINVASMGYYTVNFSNPITILPGGSDVVATIVQVNGSADDNASDDSKTVHLNPVVPAPGKLVIGEEATGTWCQWCPRGAVALRTMDAKYKGFFQGIAVHNNDPMMYYNYDRGMGNYISGYPSALTDRGAKIDPSSFEGDFLNRIIVPPAAILHNGASYNSGTRVLKVSLTTKFVKAISGNYKIACVLTEDSVTGTSSSYNQSNAYSGGANGVMGGFETLSNPVPASKMVYDHVARIISPGFLGMPNAFGSRSIGDSVVHNFTFDIPSDWNIDRMHIVGLFIDPTGKIDNGSASHVQDAITSGFVSGTEVLSTQTLQGPDAALQVYPNPVRDHFTIMTGQPFTQLQVTDMTGKVVFEAAHGDRLNVDATLWMPGVYLVSATTPGGVQTQKIIKN